MDHCRIKKRGRQNKNAKNNCIKTFGKDFDKHFIKCDASKETQKVIKKCVDPKASNTQQVKD